MDCSLPGSFVHGVVIIIIVIIIITTIIDIINSSLIIFLRNLLIVFHSDYTSYISHYQCWRVPFSPPSPAFVICSFFLMMAILTNVSCYLNDILICMPREAWCAAIHGVAKSLTRLSD